MPDYILKITTKQADKPIVTERLVRAKNEARAIAHVVADTVSVDRVSADELIRLTKAGISMEQAA